MDGVETSVMIAMSVIIILPLILSKIMDDFFKNKKELLMHWRHFWISISLSFTYLMTSMMRVFMEVNSKIIIAEYKALDATIETTCETFCLVFDTIISTQMIVLMCWFSYLAIITVIFYINKFSKAGDKAEYE